MVKYTVAATARETGFSEPSIRHRIARGTLAVLREGGVVQGRIFVPATEVARLRALHEGMIQDAR